jgi:hypothetical protein
VRPISWAPYTLDQEVLYNSLRRMFGSVSNHPCSGHFCSEVMVMAISL